MDLEQSALAATGDQKEQVCLHTLKNASGTHGARSTRQQFSS